MNRWLQGESDENYVTNSIVILGRLAILDGYGIAIRDSWSSPIQSIKINFISLYYF
jgi:hypothetical protein